MTVHGGKVLEYGQVQYWCQYLGIVFCFHSSLKRLANELTLVG